MSSRVLTSALGSLRAAAASASSSLSPAAAAAAWSAPSQQALGLAASTSAGARALSSLAAGSSFKLPALPYGVGDLAPHVSSEIMALHHGKHHAAYVAGLNAALDKYASASAAGRLDECISLQAAIRFHGGGHLNHSIFWSNLAPAGRGGGGEPGGDIGAAIASRWGSFAAFKTAMTAAAVGVQGSGWAWLGYSKASGRLEIAACANQDPLLAVTGLTPLLGLDVWEHAYYLQYRNVRADYLTAVWHIINWSDVGARLAAAKA